MSSAATPPPGGGSVQLQVTIDTTTGSLQVKNFGKLLDDLGVKLDNANQKPAPSSQGWTDLIAQTYAAVQGLEAYTAAIKSTIVESTYLAARIQVMNTVLGLTSANMNYSTGSALAQVKAIQSLNITHQEAINTVLQFERAQLRMADASRVARAAQDLAVVSNQNSSEALGTLIEAVQTQREILLRQFGIVATLPQIYEKYAASVNKSAASLTDLDKRQAMVNLIITESSKISGAYILAMDDAGKKLTSLTRLHQEAQEQIGKGFVPAMNLAIDALSSFLEFLKKVPAPMYVFIGYLSATAGGLLAVTAAIPALIGLYERLKVAVGTLTSTIGLSGAAMIGWALAIGAVVAAIGTLLTYQAGQRKANIELAGQRAAEVEQWNAIGKSLDALAEKRKRYNEVSGGAPLTSAERGVHPYISTEDQDALAKEKMKNDLVEREKMLRQDIKATGIDVVSILGDEGTQLKSLVPLYEAISKFQKQRKEELGKTLDDLQATRQEQQKYVDELKKERDIARGKADWVEQMEDANDKLYGGTKALLGPVGTVMGAYDLFTSKTASGMVDLNNKISENEKQLKSLDMNIKQVTEARSGTQRTAVDLSITAEGVSKLTAVYAQYDQMVRTGVESSKMEDSVKRQALAALTAFYDVQIKNLRATAEQAKQLGISDTAMKILYADLATFEQKQNELNALIENKSIKNFKDLSNVIKKYGEDLRTSGDHATALQNPTTGGLEAQMKINQELIAAQEKQNAEAVLGLQLEEARTKASITRLRARQQDLSDIERINALELKSLDTNYRITATQDRKTAAAAKVTMEAQKLNAIYEAHMTALRTQDQIETSRIASITASRTATGASLQQQIDLIERRYRVEIEGIEHSAAVKEKREADIYSKERQREAEIFTLQQKTIQARYQEQQESIKRSEEIYRSNTRTFADETKYLLEITALIDKGANSEIQALKENAALRIELINKGFTTEQANNIILQKQEAVRAAANQRIWELGVSYTEKQMELENSISEMEMRAGVAAYKYSEEEVALLSQKASLQKQAFDLVKQFPEMEEEIYDWESKITGQLERQSKLREQQSKAAALKTVLQSQFDPNTSNRVPDSILKGASEQLAKMHEVAGEKVAELSERIRNSNGTIENSIELWKEYCDALNLYKDTAGGVSEGMINLREISYGLSDALEQTFEAIGKGTGSALQAMRDFTASLIRDTIGKKAKVKLAEEIAEAISSAAALDFAGMGRHMLAAAQWGAVLAASGLAAGAVSGGGAGGGQGNNNATTAQDALQPISTRTRLEDNIVRLEKSLIWNGQMVLQSGQPLQQLSKTFVDSINSGKVYQPVAAAVADTINNSVGDKIAAASKVNSTVSNNTVSLLKDIHSELVKANEKDMNVSLSNEISIDGQDVQNMLDGNFVRNTRKYNRSVSDALVASNNDNLNRRDLVNSLVNGGVG